MALNRLLLGLLVATGVLVVPTQAAALVHISANQRSGEITVIADNVRVDGTATASVTVIDGSLTVGPHGRLLDRAIVVGGYTTILPGGTIKGDVVQFGSHWPLPEGVAAVALIVALLLGRVLLVWLTVTAAGLLAHTGRTRTVREEVNAYPLRTVLVGMVAGLGIGAGSLILAITILGLVAAAALWALLLAAAITTFAALLEATPDPKLRRVLGVALFLPILGEMITSLAIIIGLGATIRTSTMIARSSPSTP
ncbi:MAG TPA: hypothetical protein VGO31_15435 [Microbacteriaceae bacterium]|jgi:hypothetical protein|nr:hypothetical protein [Microbacteriaceae bacterium]